jgi:hypothetical protein
MSKGKFDTTRNRSKPFLGGIPGAFFPAVPRPTDTHPSAVIYPDYLGFLILISALLVPGIGLLRKKKQ